MTISEVDRLRQEIHKLLAARGEERIREKTFQARFDECCVDLYRAVLRARLDAEEPILAEHHVVRSHLRPHHSILRDHAQEAICLFLTDRRLLCLRAVFVPDRPVTADQEDGTVVIEALLGDIQSVRRRRQVRAGEAVAGAVICAAAFLFHPWLLVTGTFLAILGALGILHGLLLPTAWLEVEAGGATSEGPIPIYATRKRSARRLVELLTGFLDARRGCGPGDGDGTSQ
jgi:hypothetical protein